MTRAGFHVPTKWQVELLLLRLFLGAKSKIMIASGDQATQYSLRVVVTESIYLVITMSNPSSRRTRN